MVKVTSSAKQSWGVHLLFSVVIICGGFVGVLGGGGGEANVKEAPQKQPTPRPIQDTTSLTTDPLRNLLVISTLDGTLTALDRISGDIRWINHDKPMIQVPLNHPPPQKPPSPSDTHQNQSKLPKAPYFLPDPKTGSLYMMGKQNSLRKLPFTIPQLVAMAPCRNSEGLMYTGKKLDMWLSLNPYTGEKHEMPMDGGGMETCPKWNSPYGQHESHCSPDDDKKPSFVKSVLIGKTEYTLSMMDGPRKWNVTYHHYSSNDMSTQSLQDYEQVHFTSPAEGHLMTYDRQSGELLWQVELTSPVVGLYTIDGPSTNLVSVPFNPIASDTLERLKGGESASNSKALSPTTYVGECAYGLYAVPALADEHVLLIGDGDNLPKLLEGPATSAGKQYFGTGRTSGDGDYLLLGYYQVGSEQGSGSGNSPPQIEGVGNEGELNPPFNDSKIIPVPPTKAPTPPSPQQQPNPSQETTPNKPQFPPTIPTTSTLKKPTKEEIKIVFTTAVISIAITSSILGVLFFAYRRHKNNQLAQQQRLMSSDSGMNSGERSSGRSISSFIDTSTGELCVGKITLFPRQVLGKGCEGTFVFKGKFEGRDVAVKRILPECFNLADREVDLLKESDQHINVIRYFCTESDGQFRYIALELCVATLSDWVEGRWESGGINIDGVELLRDATEGLSHLHSLRIVHRDVKPANVLLSLMGGKVRTMISDFGLCKKIRDGRGSYSRRSGGVPGTDGWIAPEVVCGIGEGGGDGVGGRMTYSVDIFSMGCVYYYVLTSGAHPFGDPFRRQSNIITGDYDINQISENPRGAYNLVRAMISTNASERPPLRAILTHPFFWSSDKILSFFLDVSDRIEKETEESFPLLRRLEGNASEIVRGDWRDHICTHVAMDLRKYRTYKGDNLRDLLRALRNKKNHYRELTKEAQESLGTVPEGFVSYWINTFPSLLEHVYGVFESAKRDPGFGRYYDEAYNWGDEVEYLQDYELEPQTRDNSPKKVGKDFWRSKSQAKYQRWRSTHRARGSPNNRTNEPREANGTELSASTDNYWRGKSPAGGKENKAD